MAKHIGIVACSAEGAALCYRTICIEASREMGTHMHPEISMHTYPLEEYMKHIRVGNWKGVADLMLSSCRKISLAGAEFIICPDNTIHQAIEFVTEKSPLPWLHIAEVVAEEAKQNRFNCLGILGTKYLMLGPVYPRFLNELNISYHRPNESDCEWIDEIIFSELVNGVLLEKTRIYFNEVINKLKEKGCDAVVLGCTEIPLIIDSNDCPLPTLDSTRLLSRAALKRAIK